MKNERISRRSFVGGVTRAAAAATIVPRHVLGGVGFQAPSDTVNVAVVGMGGMGGNNAEALVAGGQRIAAVVDVDFGLVERSVAGKTKDQDGKPRPEGLALAEQFRTARRYADVRRMLEKEGKNIDAVVVATPDHFHAVAANAAMQLGKHVYVQKPLTYTVHEARTLADTARRTGVVTQMGNQGHSSDDARLINEWVQAGIIGPVREVHVWTNRPIWPQGLPRPAAAHAMPQADAWHQWDVSSVLSGLMGGNYPVPQGLDWDLFLGPGPVVTYHPIYHPFSWRGWADWGVGALGDMGAHLIDHPFWALDLGLPTSIESTSTPFGKDADGNLASYPEAMQVHYDFAARNGQPPVRLTWYDGGLMPARPDLLPDDVPLDRGGGVLFIGDRGILMHETYGRNPRLFPTSLMDAAARVPQRYRRIGTSHEMNWINAIRGTDQATSPFSYAARLTETMLLGLVALRAGEGKKIVYDGDAMQVLNVPEANQYLRRDYRSGWSL
ncbi:MAG TPA: Gfo/Idh/MocA family oxidoreductase [Longimicrobiaceae bacterium]|nr:Gfo/Idh/MocA family oxidoreductase [Longimicrobiaceae bacterium]